MKKKSSVCLYVAKIYFCAYPYLTLEQHLPLAHTPFPLSPPPHVPTSPFAAVAGVVAAVTTVGVSSKITNRPSPRVCCGCCCAAAGDIIMAVASSIAERMVDCAV